MRLAPMPDGRDDMNLAHVLVGFDFSAASYTAFWHGVGVAQRLAERLTLLHVDEVSSLTLPHDAGLRFVGRRRRRLLDDLAALGRASTLETRPLIRAGDAVETLLASVEHEAADLLVLGRRQLSGLRRWLQGSVSETVSARAMCPVLVVPEAAQPGAHRPCDASPYRHIMLATDLRSLSTRALDVVLELTERLDARLTVVNVAGPAPGLAIAGQPTISGFEAGLGGLERASRSRLRRMLDARDARGLARARMIAGGLVGQSLLRVAREMEADLLVVPHHAPGVVERLLAGTTSRALVRRSPVDVLTLSSVALDRVLGVGRARLPSRGCQTPS